MFYSDIQIHVIWQTVQTSASKAGLANVSTIISPSSLILCRYYTEVTGNEQKGF